MSDRYYTRPFTSAYDYGAPQFRTTSQYQNQYAKMGADANNVDIKQSNISQQTIIHKARLYSPDKSQQLFKHNFNNSQANDRTKTKKQIGSKIHGIVGMVEGDRDASIQQFKDVIVSQKNILGRMQEEDTQPRYVPNIDLSQFDNNYDRGTTFGPIRNQNYNIQHIQSKQGTQRDTYNTEKPIGFRDNIYKKSAIDDLKTDRNAQEAAAQQIQQQQYPQHSQHSRSFGKPPAGLSDDTYVIIQQIQRKAMEEIETLRSQKIQLMKRLNQEIKAHNQEKRLRIQLQNQLARIKGGQGKHKTQNQRSNQQIYRAPQPQQQKSHSQPHFNLVQPHHFQDEEQPYFNQQQPQFNKTQPSIPSQTYYPPFQPQYQSTQPTIISPIPRRVATQPQQQDQHEALYQRQLIKLHQQNINLKRNMSSANTKQPSRNTEKQALRRQVAQLNDKIRQYQSQIQRVNSTKTNDSSDIHALYQQGQRIQAETRRLLKTHGLDGQNQPIYTVNQGFEQRNDNADVYQDMHNFKRRLVQLEQQNQQLKQHASRGVKKDYYESIGRASLPVNNKVSRNSINTQNDDKYRQFEKVLGLVQNVLR